METLKPIEFKRKEKEEILNYADVPDLSNLDEVIGNKILWIGLYAIAHLLFYRYNIQYTLTTLDSILLVIKESIFKMIILLQPNFAFF